MKGDEKAAVSDPKERTDEPADIGVLEEAYVKPDGTWGWRQVQPSESDLRIMRALARGRAAWREADATELLH